MNRTIQVIIGIVIGLIALYVMINYVIKTLG